MTLSFSDCPHQFLKLAIGMVLVTPAGGGEVRLSSDGTGVMGITTLANEDRVILRLRQALAPDCKVLRLYKPIE